MPNFILAKLETKGWKPEPKSEFLQLALPESHAREADLVGSRLFCGIRGDIRHQQDSPCIQVCDRSPDIAVTVRAIEGVERC